MNWGLLAARSFVLVFIVLALLYHFIPSVGLWVQSHFQAATERCQSHYHSMRNFVEDRNYHVPEVDQKPTESIAEFYRENSNREKSLKYYGYYTPQGFKRANAPHVINPVPPKTTSESETPSIPPDTEKNNIQSTAK
jgi:hypothetical protein